MEVCDKVHDLHAAHSARPEANRERIATFVREIATITFDEACAERFGRIKAILAAGGLRVPDFDIAIAATALSLAGFW